MGGHMRPLVCTQSGLPTVDSGLPTLLSLPCSHHPAMGRTWCRKAERLSDAAATTRSPMLAAPPWQGALFLPGSSSGGSTSFSLCCCYAGRRRLTTAVQQMQGSQGQGSRAGRLEPAADILHLPYPLCLALLQLCCRGRAGKGNASCLSILKRWPLYQ